MNKKQNKKLMKIYKKLYAYFGPRHWWPAQSPFEVMVGAILTQNTAWPNVEKAIANLKNENLLSPDKMRIATLARLKALIRPSGFYKEKAKKLKEIASFLKRYGSRLNTLRTDDTGVLRERFLNIRGIGAETADSILLYALGKPIFVVDAYTKRVFARHKLIKTDAHYDEIQEFFMDNLPKSVKLYNEYHALIVELGKRYCKKNKPACALCPLRGGV